MFISFGWLMILFTISTTVLILSIHSIDYGERSVDISNYNCKFVALLSALLVFFSYLKLCYSMYNTLGLYVYIIMSFDELTC